MRLTANDVRKVAELAEKLSRGRFRLGYTRSDVDGTVYVDGIRQLVWRGRTGGAQAFAYYYGACQAYNADAGKTIGELPEDIRETASALMSRTGYMKWLDAGQNDANARMRY